MPFSDMSDNSYEPLQNMTIVLSRGQSHSPTKRALEESLIGELSKLEGLERLVIPHLYDLTPGGPAERALQQIPGHFVLLSWLYNRAAHWTLDQYNVRGRLGQTRLAHAWDERMEKERARETGTPEPSRRPLDYRPQPDREIFHLDLRASQDPQVYLDELNRLVAAMPHHAAPPQPNRHSSGASTPARKPMELKVIDETVSRRWYPVIDFSRCTNCMECIDFCLFGVYGIDEQEVILVEQPDNCRKGCPACSRVCPENAIMFPQHKTPEIAGDPSAGGQTKIDLSDLFGKPNQQETAAREREEHLRESGQSGRAAETSKPATDPQPHQNDDLDQLIDELDDLDL